MMYRWATALVVVGTLAWHPVETEAALVIRAEDADIRTEGGPHPGGGWNLWSNGRVGQPLGFKDAGSYGIVVRAWGSPAGGVWPEMALLVLDARTPREAVLKAIQWSCDRQAEVLAEPADDRIREAEIVEWQLDDQITVNETGFGNSRSNVFDTVELAAVREFLVRRI
jgi:hypothetical protein